MADRKRVINGLQNLRDAIATDFIHEADQAVGTIDDALELLKEQEGIIASLKSDLAETLDVVAQQKNVVRCKECKHRGDMHKCIVAFVASKQDFPVRFYDNDGNWFCADGKQISE